MNTNKQTVAESVEMRVVRHRPWRRPLLIAIWLLTLVLVSGTAVLLTTLQHRQVSDSLAAALTQAQSDLLASETDRAELQRQVAMQRTAIDIDRQAADAVRHEIQALQNQVTELESEIRFYRSLMSPGSQAAGLAVGEFELSRAIDGSIRYHTVVQQMAAQHRLVNGYLQVSVVGRQQGRDIQLPLAALDKSVSERGIKLRFKYFQTIEGDMILPSDFEPRWLQLTISAEKFEDHSTKVEWQLQE